MRKILMLALVGLMIAVAPVMAQAESHGNEDPNAVSRLIMKGKQAYALVKDANACLKIHPVLEEIEGVGLFLDTVNFLKSQEDFDLAGEHAKPFVDMVRYYHGYQNAESKLGYLNAWRDSGALPKMDIADRAGFFIKAREAAENLPPFLACGINTAGAYYFQRLALFKPEVVHDYLRGPVAFIATKAAFGNKAAENLMAEWLGYIEILAARFGQK